MEALFKVFQGYGSGSFVPFSPSGPERMLDAAYLCMMYMM